MPTGPRRPGFYLGVLIAGFVAGGALNLVVSFTLGPIGLHVSLLSLIGVVLAYLIARSLF
jgi:hypothetical protein